MLRNYIKTAIRNLWREKGSTTLNVFGLTLGIAASLILFLLIRHNHTFDTYHKNYSRIYRVNTMSDGNSGKNYTSGVPSLLPEAFRMDFPETEEVTFTSYRSGGLVTIPQASGAPKKFEEERGITFAQSNFFKIFDGKILIGDAAKALDEPNEAILSRSWSKKYFGKEDAVGEVIRVDTRDYRIGAIMEDPPVNTDLPFHLMLSYATIKKELDEHGWNSIWSDEHCYFTLKEGEQASKIESRMPAFVKKYLGDDNRDNQTFVLQPLSELHFDDRFGNYNYNTVGRPMLLSLGLIAAFLIITACINFINLSTAEAIKRSKEVGIRKSLGSSRLQLVTQFLGQTSLITLCAMILAIALAQASLGLLNGFLELHLKLDTSDSMLWIFITVVTISVSLLSGLYPSLVMSAYNPVLSLKNKISCRGSSGFVLRRTLVVLQFFISQFLIIGTIVIISQTNYFQSKELGFRKEAIITIPIPVEEVPADSGKVSMMRTLRDEVMRLRGVERASLNYSPPSSGHVSGTGFTMEGDENFYETQVKPIDGNYVELFDLKLVAGQNILDFDTAQGFLVNEKLASMVGYKDPSAIIGKRMKMWGRTLPIVGVLKDFHTMSLRAPIEPTVMLNRIRNYASMAVQINPQDMQGSIEEIKEKWESSYPDFIFSYEFLDEYIRKFYDSQQRGAILLSIFTSMAILIGCLGLFGLASFMANQKTKEIGVRKVMGASVENILLLFTKEFIVLIFVGFLLAAPLAWFAMSQWLNEFAYKIELGPFMFVAGLGVTLTIALLTVGYRSLKAATVNPVDSLKYE